MKLKVILVISGLILGTVFGILVVLNFLVPKNDSSVINPLSPKKEVIGFLPYWLLDRATGDYSKYITTLTYFGVRVNSDGNIQKLLNPQQEEPGWYALESGKLNSFFSAAKRNNISLSLLVSSGDQTSIGQLMNDPIKHAKNLLGDLNPLIEKYKFSDINLDIEYTSTASEGARTNFTKFVKEIKKGLGNKITLTVEISPTDVILNDLIDPKAIGEIADNVVLMAYDYHSTTSYVTGPVAPVGGAGIDSEYDVITALEKSISVIPPEKLILGVPLYGYEWESLGQIPRSAIIPNTGLVLSNRRAEEFLSGCSTCSAKLDKEAEEEYISYFNGDSNDYHMLFYPDENSMTKKINLVNSMQLKGIALWALGYEGNKILSPLVNY